MKRHFKWDKKYLYWGVTAFTVVACAILFYMALNYIPALGGAIGSLLKILSPFIWGLVISYLLNPLTKAMEKQVFSPLIDRINRRRGRKTQGIRLARGLSVFLSEIVLLAVLTALVYLIIPQLYNSIEMIVQNSNVYFYNINEWVTRLLEDYPEIEQYARSTLGEANKDLIGWLQTSVLPRLGSIVTNVTAGMYYLLMGIYNLVIGIIVSVYILSNMENFVAGAKRLLYSLFRLETAEKLREGIAFTDQTFMGFINGKLLDSAIVGLICYIVCAILNMPYALLVSVIVGVTNIIPFFGPFIGAIPSAVIILMVSPPKCLIFIIFIIILQQLDGNIIGPKILGNTIGINGFWVMFAIILGTGLFGFWGMLLGVPVFVVIYTAIGGMISRRLRENDLPCDQEEYLDLDHIDPVTHRIIKKPAPAGAEAGSKKSEGKKG